MHILVVPSKQKLFLTPTGASYNIESKTDMWGKQEQTKSGQIAPKNTTKNQSKIKQTKTAMGIQIFYLRPLL